MKKLLVTGASGFLGWNCCAHAQKEWSVYGTVFSHPIAIPGCTQVPVDLTDAADLTRIFHAIQPDAVIHTAAVSQPDICEQNPAMTDRINIDAVGHIAELCADAAIPLVFTSTDLVFDGEHPPYTEKDTVAPVNRYGEQKVKAEEQIRACYPEAAICRMPLMYGDGSLVSSSTLQPILASLRTGKPAHLFTDQIRTPLGAYSASVGLLLALKGFHGTFHLGGKEVVSRYAFGVRVANYCGLDPSPLKPVLQRETVMKVARPIDVSLDSTRACSLGFSPHSIKEEFKVISCMNEK